MINGSRSPWPTWNPWSQKISRQIGKSNAIANQLHQITNSKGSQCTLISESAPSCSVSVDPTHRGLMSGAVEHFGCTLDKLQKLIKSNTFKFGDQRCPQPASELLSQHGQWTSLDCSTIVSGILCVRESLHTPILNLLHHPRWKSSVMVSGFCCVLENFKLQCSFSRFTDFKPRVFFDSSRLKWMIFLPLCFKRNKDRARIPLCNLKRWHEIASPQMHVCFVQRPQKASGVQKRMFFPFLLCISGLFI